VALAYSENSVWRNRDQFISGRAEIVSFLRSKWAQVGGLFRCVIGVAGPDAVPAEVGAGLGADPGRNRVDRCADDRQPLEQRGVLGV
jgi:hypothetical protein